MTSRSLTIAITGLLIALTVEQGFSQEPTYMDAATHPGAGQLYTRLLASYSEYEEGGEQIERRAAVLKVVYGVSSTFALIAEGEFADISGDVEGESGVLASALDLKVRLFKRDLGPLNTWMASVFGGLTMPGDMDIVEDLDAYPRGALVSTAILGRHGLNGELEWNEHGGEPDQFAVNGSYLYRLAPAEYAANTKAAWYTMIESLNEFTDDGESRSNVAAGILYEAQRWAWEVSVRLPIDEDWPQEEDYRLTAGVRYLP